MSKKQEAAEAEPTAKECRVCWGSDEDGEEDWVAPCRCSRNIAWVHRRCLAWRLKHTRIAEDKLRCAVCKHVYELRLRLKSLSEWFADWSAERHAVIFDLLLVVLIPPTLYGASKMLHVLKGVWQMTVLIYRDGEIMYAPLLLLMLVSLCCWLHSVFRIARLIAHRVHAAHRWPARFGLSLYKRFLAVAARDWVLDAPAPLRNSAPANSG